MTRQAFIRVLLSLLLLVSQQMASSHAMSHLTGSLDRAPASQTRQGASDNLSGAFAQDQSCQHFLAFAQLAVPLASAPPALVIPRQTSSVIELVDVRDGGARIILAFQSRAPPVLS